MKNGNTSLVTQQPPGVVVASHRWLNHNHQYIRPLAVSPLTYPERLPTPWGFSMPEFQKLRTIRNAWHLLRLGATP